MIQAQAGDRVAFSRLADEEWERLRRIAFGILRRADDSVVQVCDDGPLFFRRSRGYAPVPTIVRGAAAAGPVVLAAADSAGPSGGATAGSDYSSAGIRVCVDCEFVSLFPG